MLSAEQDKLHRLVQLFETAEKHVKKAEDVNGNIVIPSINELRYFGYHIAKALLAEDDPATLAKEIEKAEGHAKRAIYDASEALIVFYLEKAEQFHIRHQDSDSIVEILPEYIDYLDQLEQIKTQIHEIRDNQDAYRNRDQYYEQTLPFIDSLSRIVSKFQKANPLIIKRDRKKAKGVMLLTATLIATIVGSLLAFML